MALVEQLKDVATKTDKLELIGIGVEGTEEEKEEKKHALFKRVKYFYVAEKGIPQTGDAKKSKKNAREILTSFLLQQMNVAASVGATSVSTPEAMVEAAFSIASERNPQPSRSSVRKY